MCDPRTVGGETLDLKFLLLASLFLHLTLRFTFRRLEIGMFIVQAVRLDRKNEILDINRSYAAAWHSICVKSGLAEPPTGTCRS